MADTQNRGTDWIDVSADLQTIFYTSEGTKVKRVSINGVQGSDFADVSAHTDGMLFTDGSPCYALRLLSDGGLMMTCWDKVMHLDSSGNFIRSYIDCAPTPCNFAAHGQYFALNLDPDGVSFWTGNNGNPPFNVPPRTVYNLRIDNGSGLHQFDTDSNFNQLNGLAVVGEFTVSGKLPSLPNTGHA